MPVYSARPVLILGVLALTRYSNNGVFAVDCTPSNVERINNALANAELSGTCIGFTTLTPEAASSYDYCTNQVCREYLKEVISEWPDCKVDGNDIKALINAELVKSCNGAGIDSTPPIDDQDTTDTLPTDEEEGAIDATGDSPASSSAPNETGLVMSAIWITMVTSLALFCRSIWLSIA